MHLHYPPASHDRMGSRCAYLDLKVQFAQNYLITMDRSWLLLLCLASAVMAQQPNTGLSSAGLTSLDTSGFISSPDGEYRLTLLTNCSLKISKFNSNSEQFQSYDILTSSAVTSSSTCRSVSVSTENRALMTNQNLALMALNKNTIYDRITLKIIYRESSTVLVTLEGQYVDAGSQHKSVDNSYLPQILGSAFQFTTKTMGNGTMGSNLLNSINNFKNSQGWNFLYLDQKLVISKPGVEAKTIDLKGVKIGEEGIMDGQGEQKYGVLPGRTLHPRAGPSKCSNPRDLFYRIDDKYPIVRVFDGSNYQVMELGYTAPEAYPTMICPQGTFENKGACTTSCPKSYKKQIRMGGGRCVLECEAGSTQNNGVCTSINYPSGIVATNLVCPGNSTKYEFGCICSGTFLQNNKRQEFAWSSLTNQCAGTCPMGAIKLAGQGVCVSCPNECNECELDSQTRSYLICTSLSTQCDISNCESCSNGKCHMCLPFFSLSIDQSSCLVNCPAGQKYVMGSSGEGYCMSLNGGLSGNFIGGVYNSKPYLVATNCPSNKVTQGFECLDRCKAGFKANSNNICVCQRAGETFFNGRCGEYSYPPAGFYYNSAYQTYLNCPVGCATCNSAHCLSCASGNILVVSTSGSTCRRNSALFVCDPQYFHFDQATMSCIPSTMWNNGISSNCLISNGNLCSLCKPGYQPSQDNRACLGVPICPIGYFNHKGQCVAQLPLCEQSYVSAFSSRVTLTDEVIKSDGYRAFTKNGEEISSDPALEIMAVRSNLMIKPASTPMHFRTNAVKVACRKCVRGYVVENGICVPYVFTEECPFTLEDGKRTCVGSCPEKTVPVKNQNGSLICSKSLNSAPDRLKLDAAVYTFDPDTNEKLYYFLTSDVLKSNPTVGYYEVFTDARRLLQTSPEALEAKFQNNTYLAIKSKADQIVLDLRRNNAVSGLQSMKGSFLGGGIYGVKNKESFREYARSWLAILSFVLSIILIILHAIYIGNSLLYKVDNALTFAQSMYYFSFINLMVGQPVAQYYYGFLWSHFGFFPNYFRATIPNGYYEGFSSSAASGPYDDSWYVPNTYRLLTGDSNFIRNAGYAFSVLATFIVAFLVVAAVVYLLKKVCGKSEVWYKKVAKQAFFAGIEFVCMAIVYWAVAHLLYNQNRAFSSIVGEPASHTNYRRGCSIAAVVFISLYLVYAIVRGCFNKFAGLYTFKRITLAVILAASTFETIKDPNTNNILGNKAVVIAIVAAEIIFMVFRFILEKPYLKRQKFFIVIEAIVLIVAYLIMYLWNDTGVVSIYCSLVLMFFIMLFVEDLVDVYNDARGQYYQDDFGFLPGATHKPVTQGNKDEWRKYSRNVKKNENPWTRNKITSSHSKDNDFVDPPNSEQARLRRTGKQL